MDEILKKLLESELLSEDTRTQIKGQFQEAVTALKEELAIGVRAELVERYTQDREDLVESLDTYVTGLIAEELDELSEDIASFRDLEVEFAAKLMTEKKKLATTLSVELEEIVDNLDAFLEARIAEEMDEFKDDLIVVKENQFGRRIYESFMAEFSRSFVGDEDSALNKVAVLEDKLQDAEDRLLEAEQANKRSNRVAKLEEVLAPLSGIKREQMDLILQNVETSKLQEAYNRYVGRVLKEDTDTGKPLTESATTRSRGGLKTGDLLESQNQETNTSRTGNLSTIRMLSLAGVK